MLLFTLMALDVKAESIQNYIQVRTGAMSYEIKSQFTPISSTNSSNFSAELVRFSKKDLATYTGYRLAQDTERERVLYQAGIFGTRYYFLNLGAPIRAKRNTTIVSYDFPLKVYIEGGASLGRMLILTRRANQFEVSSEFYGLTAGLGFKIALADYIAFDLVGIYESDKGYGAIPFEATNTWMLAGFNYYY